jgi:hypothetical protein
MSEIYGLSSRPAFSSTMPMPAQNYGMSNWGMGEDTGMRVPGAPITSVSQLGLGKASPGTSAPSLWEQFSNAPLLPWTSTDVNGARQSGSGLLMPGLQLASGALNAWMGMKNYGLAKKQFAENKNQYALNYDAQRTTTNAQLEDRQRARVASNAGAYQSVGEYMGQNGIKPRG